MDNGIRRILTKKEFYDLYNAGVLGNKPLTWDSYEQILKSGWQGKVCIRNRKGGKAMYNVPLEKLSQEIERYLKMGYSVGDLTFNQAMPDEHLLIQGELMLRPWGYYLLYSTLKKPMNIALKEEPKHANSLEALSLLKTNLWPHSYTDLMDLLDIYSESIIELGAYDIAVGDLPNRNTIIWEVRNY